MRKNGVQIWMVASLCLALVVSLGGCASTGDSGATGDSTSDTSSTSSATRTIPSSSPLAKVQNGMNDSEVRNLLGEAGGTRSYPSAMAFVPFYPNGWRVVWTYPNVGRVVFSRNQWSGSMAVVDIQHNPDETK